MDMSIGNHMNLNSKLNEKNKINSYSLKNGSKRSAEQSPEGEVRKRAVFGDITNRTNHKQPGKVNIDKKAVKKVEIKSSKKEIENQKVVACEDEKNESKHCLSRNESEESVMYTSAVEEINSDESETQVEVFTTSVEKALPPGVEDFDKANVNDIFSESRYVSDIFSYYKEREVEFQVKKYMSKQTEMNKGMRAILVDWMVEVQESFELNHETLYLAVKLVDHFLMRHFVPKSQLQLIGATATFVASKFDERIPPLVDDFLYICDDSYSREQLIRTEIKMLQTVDFTLGIPLSYRFLRRYARCSRISMELLTLARYILETALMDYDLVDVRDSKLAAGALILALKMKDENWTPTLSYYSGYNEDDLEDVMNSLNKNISIPASRHLQTIRTKYSHSIFFEVAKIPTLNLTRAKK